MTTQTVTNDSLFDNPFLEKSRPSSVTELLEGKARLFKEKGEEYGHTYKEFGKVLTALGLKSVDFTKENDGNKFGLYFMLIHKFMRVSKTIFSENPSLDSVADIQVYAAMLEEVLREEDPE